ncbi:MAG TPA: LysR family transcriptional regulator [Rhodanobacteraceae bacterium]
MNLSEIKVFLTLCDELHFGRTAERMGLSQARVSRLVHSLESEVGGMLFKRTSRRVVLTPLGERLHERLRPAYERLSEALEDARRMVHEPLGELRIGFTSTTAGTALNRLIAAFERREPDCETTVREVSIIDPYSALRRGEIDILVDWLEVDEPDLKVGPAIGHDKRVLAVAADHKLARREAIHLNDIAGFDAARLPSTFPSALEEAFLPRTTPSGAPIPRTHIVHSFAEYATLVARGLVVQGTVASMAAGLPREDIVLIPIADLPPLALGLIWRKAQENDLIRAVAEAARSLQLRQK